MLGLARAGAAEGAWLRAERQTAGRGRLGRAWASPPGNLYATTLVRLRAADPPGPSLALVAGVALAEVAAAFARAAQLQLKWPNDLVAAGGKLAGILMERHGEAVAIGFGVNLAHHPELPDRPATSLAALGSGAPEPQAFCLELAEACARWLARWRGEGLEPVRRAWLARAHPLGAPIAFTGLAGRVEGLFDGLEPDGALRLRRSDGALEVVRAGDVALL